MTALLLILAVATATMVARRLVRAIRSDGYGHRPPPLQFTSSLRDPEHWHGYAA